MFLNKATYRDMKNISCGKKLDTCSSDISTEQRQAQDVKGTHS